MADRILKLADSSDPDVAIKALKVGLDKVLPNLEEVEHSGTTNPFSAFDPKELPGLLESIDRELATRQNGAANGDGGQP